MQDVASALRGFDWDHYRDIAAELLDGGKTEEEIVQLLAVAVDAALPFAILVPPPVGLALEVVDGVIFEAILRPLVKVLRDPEKREKWKAHRAEVRAAREARQAARKAAKGA